MLEPCALSPTVSIDPHKRRLGAHTTAGFTSRKWPVRPSAALPLLSSSPPTPRTALDRQHVVMPLVTRAMRVMGHVSSADSG
jgi:hypothetical protein